MKSRIREIPIIFYSLIVFDMIFIGCLRFFRLEHLIKD